MIASLRLFGFALLVFAIVPTSADAQVSITDPADNASITIGADSATYTVKVTITGTFSPTGGSLAYQSNGMTTNLCQLQSGDFVKDPNDGTKYTVNIQAPKGSYTNVTLKIKAHRDASSADGGTPAADADDTSTGLTVTKN